MQKLLTLLALIRPKRKIRWLITLIALSGFIVFLLLMTPASRSAFHTAMFISQILDLGIQPQTWLTSEPVSYEITYPRGQQQGQADIYRNPNSTTQAAILLFLGANAAGPNDPEVINLGNALARAGFVTMFHWSPTMGLHKNIDYAEVDNLVHAFQYLQSLDYVDNRKIGIGGFCIGASFALVAATDPRIRDDVVFVNAFGPYFDAKDLFYQITSRSWIYGTQTSLWNPNSLTLQVFANELIETLEDSENVEKLYNKYVKSETIADSDFTNLTYSENLVKRLID